MPPCTPWQRAAEGFDPPDINHTLSGQMAQEGIMSALSKNGFMLFTVLVLTGATPLWAVKVPDMPKDFGSEEWAVSNWNAAVGYLKYVADTRKQQALLSVPAGLRKEAWEEFWKDFDPVRSTPENEFSAAYFQRVQYANVHFGTNLQYGWLTDRGEAYVRLGPPAETETYTMRANGKDLEIWQYWAPAEFYLYFVDQTGFGDFVLLNPDVMIHESFLPGR
jgi:GWxTD domain-containing protein